MIGIALEKPHVVAVINSWYNCIPEFGPTNQAWGLIASLETSSLFDFTRFPLDEYAHKFKQSADTALIELCRKKRPKLVFIQWTPRAWLTVYPSFCNPSLEALEIIRKETGAHIVAALTDTYQMEGIKTGEILSQFCDVVVALDSNRFLLDSQFPERYIFELEPMDGRIFKDIHCERDLDVSFVGSTANWGPGGSYEKRREILDYVAARCNLTLLGGRTTDQAISKDSMSNKLDLPVEEFARIIQRSKISLNVSVAPDGRIPIRARTMQVKLCGALAIEDESSLLNTFYEPYREYVPFKNPADLVEKIEYYLAHPQDRIEIAERGRDKAVKIHTGEMFWRNIFKKLDQISPPRLSGREKAIALNMIENQEPDRAVDHLKSWALESQSIESFFTLAGVLRGNGRLKESNDALRRGHQLDVALPWLKTLEEAIIQWNARSRVEADIFGPYTPPVIVIPRGPVLVQNMNALEDLYFAPFTDGCSAFMYILKMGSAPYDSLEIRPTKDALLDFINAAPGSLAIHLGNLVFGLKTIAGWEKNRLIELLRVACTILKANKFISQGDLCAFAFTSAWLRDFDTAEKCLYEANLVPHPEISAMVIGVQQYIQQIRAEQTV